MTKKIIIITVVMLVLILLITQIEIKQDIQINELNISLLENEYYKDLNISDVSKVTITKYTEGGSDIEEIEDKDEILKIYNYLKKQTLIEETNMACEDNTVIYIFVTNDDKEYKVEKECDWFVINNKRYLYKK